PVPGGRYPEGVAMGIFSMLRRDDAARSTAREAMREARRGADAPQGGALERAVTMIGDMGRDGKLAYSSAAEIARHAQRGRGRRRPRVAERRIVRRHRRGVTAGGFLTGLGGFLTLPVLLPTNVLEFYVQATRMVGAIAAVRGYDLEDEEIRVRVLAALLGEESGDVLRNVGLGPVAGAATRTLAERLPATPQSQVASAIGGRLLRRFGLRSVRLFGKAIPGLRAVIGALSDRSPLQRIAAAARKSLPPAPRGRAVPGGRAARRAAAGPARAPLRAAVRRGAPGPRPGHRGPLGPVPAEADRRGRAEAPAAGAAGGGRIATHPCTTALEHLD